MSLVTHDAPVSSKRLQPKGVHERWPDRQASILIGDLIYKEL